MRVRRVVTTRAGGRSSGPFARFNLSAGVGDDPVAVAANRRGVESYVGRLRRAEALLVQFPTWCYGAPAMLKGYFDRLLLPGVAFDLSDPARVKPTLHNITKLAAIVTYGRPRFGAWYMGDPPRKMVTRYLHWFMSPGSSVAYLALYGLNTASDADRRAFLERVEQRLERF